MHEAGAGGAMEMRELTSSENVDVLSRRQQKESPFYAGRVKVYPMAIRGLFRRLKWYVLGLLLVIYYAVPWIRWDRGPGAPDQAVLVDMPNRRAYFFFIEIWPQEVYYLTGLLILAAIALFWVTSVAGRVWCGYACPQTVWTDLYMKVERWIEGERNARIKLDKRGLDADKAVKKTLKHAVWLLIAFATGGAWIMYFKDAPTVVAEIFTGQASGSVYFFVGLFTATTYVFAGWAREQVCTYMCPYARFQAAMFDEDTLVVTYQDWRGEPRGKLKKTDDWSKRGDCIDCNKCVAVCPTGIDIRDGVQMECIGCALCIDACNTVMEKIGRPPDLITYDTERNQERRAQGLEPVVRLVRPRTVIYGLLFVVVAGLMLWSLAFRSTLDINVLHDRSPLFVRLSDGDIRNGYTVKILNKTRERRTFTLTYAGLAGASLNVVGQELTGGRQALLRAEPDSVATYKLYMAAPPDAVRASVQDVTFVLTDLETGETARREAVFRGPER
jgi:cytochrome c oxidase accessory protein FixG